MDRAARKTLDRLLSRAGCCSRQQARRRIAAGMVQVNGRIVRDPDAWIDPGRDAVLVDGEPLRAQQREVWALHKPIGYVTTANDEHGRHTVYDLLPPGGSWLAPVGLLDRDSSGLLLFTNDSDLAHAITAPASKLPKVYEVRVKGRIAGDALHTLRTGVALRDGITKPAHVDMLAADDRTTLLRIALIEGRNRQIRRMVLALGSRVHALHRVQIGPLRLGDLPVGRARLLGAAEIRALRAAVIRAVASPSRARVR